MKIKNITKESDYVYIVTFEPSWFERFLGVEETQEKYKDTGETYTYGGGHEYINQKGEELGNYNSIREAIDKWRRRW